MTQDVNEENPSCWLEARLESGETLFEVPDGTDWSYARFAETTARIARGLAARGVKPGDRVVAQTEKSVEAAGLYWACIRMGAVYVPLNTAYTRPEVEYFLADSEPRVYVHDEILRELADQSSTEPPMFQGSPDDLAAILYTSGTTGRSKGAMLTRRNLASNAATLARVWGFSRADTLLHALPIYHTHGLFVGLNVPMAVGAKVLFLPKFDAEEALALLPRATVMMGVPTFYTRLLKSPALSRERLSAVRLFISGSAPLLAETHREFRERTGHSILERYGMTETGMNSSNPLKGRRVPGSVGPALPGVEIRVTDPVTGEPTREVGMLEIKGPNVFCGYWRNSEKTQAELRPNGYFITGDLGKIDENGYVWISGRGRDLIISGGFNVYPKEVENELDRLPGVAESAVIGVPHADFGEGVAAVVVCKPGAPLEEAEIIRALEGRLARFKLPKRVLFVDELPRNAMGKVQKSVLRDRYVNALGGSD